MAKKIILRTLEMGMTLWVVLTLCFFLLRMLPGGPFDEEEILDLGVQKELEAYYGLDKPLINQYWRYLGNVLQGDFGESFVEAGVSHSQLIYETLPVSLQIGALALFLALSFGITLGLLMAYFEEREKAGKRSTVNAVFFFLVSMGLSMPNILIAPLLVLVFSFYLDWFPVALWEGASSYVLPVLALSVRPFCLVVRMVHSSSIEVSQRDYITMARSKGLSEIDVYVKHVLPNSLMSLLGILGTMTAGILSGSFAIELIFSIPGAGQHLIEGVRSRDYGLVMAMVFLYTFLLTVMHWVVDLLSFWLNPRARGSH